MVDEDQTNTELVQALSAVEQQVTDLEGKCGQLTAALQTSETRYQQLLDVLPDGIIVHCAGEIVLANKASVELIGAEGPDQLVGKSAMSFVHPDYRQLASERIQRAVHSSTVAPLAEERFIRLDGEVIDVEVTAVPFMFQQTSAMLTVVRDITAKKKAEAALRASETRFKSVFNNAAVGIGVVDTDGRYIQVNNRWAEMLGYSVDEIYSATHLDVTHLDDAAKSREHLQALIRGEIDGYRIEKRFMRKDGSVIWGDLTVSPICDPDGTVVACLGTIVDITERKAAEGALATRNQALQTLHKVALDVGAELEMAVVLEQIIHHAMTLLQADQGGDILLLRQDGQALERLAGEGIFAGRIGEAFGLAEGLVGQVFEARAPLVVDDYRRWKSDSPDYGDLPACTVLRVPLFWKDQIIGVLGLAADPEQHLFGMNDLWLAEMFAAQAAVAIQNARLYLALATYNEKLGHTVKARTNDLQRVKERTEAILASTPDAIVLIDASHTIEAFNPAFGELFGYSLEEVIGESPDILVDASQVEAFTQMLYATSGHAQPKRLAFTARRCDDTTFDADVAAAPVITENGEIIGVVCSLRDISAFKEIDRMKDVFITQVSHQLRTPVTSIKLYTQILRDGRRPEKTEHYLDVLSSQADRLIDLIQDILEVTRFSSDQDAGTFEPVSLATVVGDVATHYSNQAAVSNLVLVAEPVPDDLPPVQGDPARLTQALDELVQNSILFTPSGGQVTIEVKTAEVEGQPWVIIAVRDSGPGIPPDEQPRVFERFFRGNLAESGHVPGAGLGLAIVEEIMELHHGFADLVSTEGAGTTFRLWLPATD